jgi:hypothetical protein
MCHTRYTVPRHGKLATMLLSSATEADYAAIVDLANLAYRGTGASASWNVETGILEGQRINESLLREDIAEKPEALLLTYREDCDSTLTGCVWLEPSTDGVWYLGLLAVQPDQQAAACSPPLRSSRKHAALIEYE